MGIEKVIIEKNTMPNYSIAKGENGKLYRFKGGIEGQEVVIRTGKLKGDYYKAKLIEITKKSPLETLDNGVNPDEMSGNKFENLEYETELELKKKMVNEVYEELYWEKEIPLNPSPVINGYRNKMEYTFGDSYLGGPLVLGMHKLGKFYEIADYDGGSIVNDDFNIIREFTQTFFRDQGLKQYHKTKGEGSLKFFVIKYSFYENAFMLNLVTKTSDEITDNLLEKYIKEALELNLNGKIISFFHTISDSIADAIVPDKINHIWGEDHLTEEINGLKFNISPFSFFQPNPKGAEKLYNKAVEFAGDISGKTVFDLYSGTGTISQIFAKKASHVIGVEIVEESVQKAKENAEINNLTNVEFRANDVLKEIDSLTQSPDIVVVDPPRAGIHQEAISKIAKMGATKIIYISCNPVTQVEDLKLFREYGYKIEKIEAFDLFPKTAHVETVALLSKLNTEHHLDIEIGEDELSEIDFSKDATYGEIKKYVLDKYGLKVSSLYIAQIKRKHGLIERENYNFSKKENQRVPNCPEEKEKAIEDALEHFGMI